MAQPSNQRFTLVLLVALALSYYTATAQTCSAGKYYDSTTLTCISNQFSINFFAKAVRKLVRHAQDPQQLALHACMNIKDLLQMQLVYLAPEPNTSMMLHSLASVLFEFCQQFSFRLPQLSRVLLQLYYSIDLHRQFLAILRPRFIVMCSLMLIRQDDDKRYFTLFQQLRIPSNLQKQNQFYLRSTFLIGSTIYVNPSGQRALALGTYEFPHRRLELAFMDIFNNYDSYPDQTIYIKIDASNTTRQIFNFKYYPLVIMDKNIVLDIYNTTASSTQFQINVTDKGNTQIYISQPYIALAQFQEGKYQYWNILTSSSTRDFYTNFAYNFYTKIAAGKMTDVQNSVITDYMITAIRGSLSINAWNIRVDLTTIDVNQKFLNMDEGNGEYLVLQNSNVTLQGTFADIKNAITAKVINNTFGLSQTNYILTVRPSCLTDFDFTKTEFFIYNNKFINQSSITISYHMFFYKGFSNVTYSNNYINNINYKGYSHFAGQFVTCSGLMSNNTNINFQVIQNYWDMSTAKDDARIDLQVQETSTNIQFNVQITNNTFWKLFSNNYFILVQNYNTKSYIEFNGNYFYETRIEDIAITFTTTTPIYIWNNYIDNLYNRLRHFLYLDGPSVAHFKNMTITNAYTGLDYNAYALILADVADGTGTLIFDSCNFTNWNIQMHYGINIAVKVQSLVIKNTIFSGVKMLPLWHILNIKEASSMTLENVTFNNYSFQAAKSSNGFAINIINFDIDPNYPNSYIKNVVVQNMSTNFLQLINAHSDTGGSTGYITFNNLTIQNNTFDAEISLIQFSGFLLSNANFEVTIDNSTFINNNFALYGNIIALKQNMIKPVIIKRSYFYNNFGAMFDLTSGNIALTSYPTQLQVDDCRFYKNTPYSKALIVVNENCKTYVYNSYFLENYSVSRGSIIMADYQETENYFANCSFYNNSASVGGVFYTQFGSMIDCYNCTVENNFGIKGGVVYTSNDGYIKFRSSKIRWNKSLYSSILVTLSSPTSYTEFTDTFIYNNTLLALTDFIDNTTYKVNLKVSELSYLKTDFLNYILANNVSIQNSVQLGLIYALNSISSNLKFYNLTIDTQINILSSFEASIIGGNLTIQNTYVTDTQNLLELTSTTFNMSGMNLINITCDTSTAAKDKYLMSALLRSSFYIDKLIINNAMNPVAFMLSSTLAMTNSILSNIKVRSTLYQPISLTDSTVNFTNVSMSTIEVSSDSMIHLSFSTLNAVTLNMTSINQTFIVASDSVLSYNTSNFYRNSSADPFNAETTDLTTQDYVRSCMYVETSTVTLLNTNITNFLTTDNGGALYSSNCDVYVSGSYFQDNHALIGGALYLYCDEDQTCDYYINKTTFVRNRGDTRGGAIHYNYFAPIIQADTLKFKDNIAPYGANISAYPYQLVVSNVATITEQVSGQTIVNPIIVQVQDYYGHIINIDNTTKIELQSWNINTTQIQGASTLTVSMGQATFDEVTLLSDPGREREALKIVIQQYDNDLVGTAYRISNSSSLNNLTVLIDFRECIVGEALQKQKCIKCPIGKFSIAENATTCANCPLNSQCPGGSLINVNQGYWRANFQSSQIHECLFSPACLGGTTWIDSYNTTWPTACANGYGGNLCHACVHSDGTMYTRVNKHECLQCSSNNTLNILRLVGIALCLVVGLSVLIILNLRRTGTNYLAVLMRMMTNYMQIISFAASFNLGWPQSLKRLYDSISIISQSSEMAFSLDCFFDNAGITSASSNTPTFFLKALLLLVLPLIALALIFLFWGIFGLIRKHSKLVFTRNILVSIIVVLFLAHPTLVSVAFSMMNCYEIESGEQWLQADLEIKCWNDLHKKWFFGVGLPMLIVWVIGMPITILFMLLKNRSKLNDEVFFSRYRMVYQGLKRKHFYWEIVNTFRKISIVSINVFLALYPDYIKAIYAMLILAIIFKMQEILQPYEIPVFNWIEQREQIASIVTFYAGLYFVKADVSEAFKYVIIVIVFFVNAWFLVLWGYVAVNQFKWAWTKKIASILRRLVCKKINDADLKPVDQDGLGMSNGTSYATKQGSSGIAKKGNAADDFDELDKEPAEKAELPANAMIDVDHNGKTYGGLEKNGSGDSGEFSDKKKKNKTKKGSSGGSSHPYVKSGSTSPQGEDDSSHKQQTEKPQQQQKQTKKKNKIIQDSSDMSDLNMEAQIKDEAKAKQEKTKKPSKKITKKKEVKENSDDEDQEQVIDESTDKVKQIKGNNFMSDSVDDVPVQMEKTKKSKKNTVKSKKSKKQSTPEQNLDDSERDRSHVIDQSIDSLNFQSTTNNLKMPYANPNQLDTRKEKVKQLLKIKNKDKKEEGAVQKKKDKKPPKSKEIRDMDESQDGMDKFSSFDENKNAAYTIKKKSKSKDRRAAKIQNSDDDDEEF